MLSSCKHRCGVYPPWLQITVSPLVFHIFLGEVHRSRPRLGFAVKVAVFCPGIFRSYPHFRRHETDRSGGRKRWPMGFFTWDFHWRSPIAGWFHGKSQAKMLKMHDLEVPPFQETSVIYPRMVSLRRWFLPLGWSSKFFGSGKSSAQGSENGITHGD